MRNNIPVATTMPKMRLIRRRGKKRNSPTWSDESREVKQQGPEVTANDGAPSPPEPLLRSGLVLAGGATQPLPDGARVTALELAGLNLWGTGWGRACTG